MKRLAMATIVKRLARERAGVVGAIVHNMTGKQSACQVVETGATQWLSCE